MSYTRTPEQEAAAERVCAMCLCSKDRKPWLKCNETCWKYKAILAPLDKTDKGE